MSSLRPLAIPRIHNADWARESGKALEHWSTSILEPRCFTLSNRETTFVGLSVRLRLTYQLPCSSLAYTAVSRLAAPRLYGDARTSACLMGRDLLFPNRSSRGSTRPHNFLAFRDTAHTGSCDAIPTIEDFAMSRVLTATMLPTAHHEEVVF